MGLFNTLPKIDHDRIVAAIAAAEQRTSGEIRVAIGRHKSADPMASARHHFERLGMGHTAGRNAVLIYVAPRSRNFAVFGDAGVHEKCGDAFWQELTKTMTEFFRRGDFDSGIVHGIERAGELLAAHFPRHGAGGNELSNQVEDVD